MCCEPLGIRPGVIDGCGGERRSGRGSDKAQFGAVRVIPCLSGEALAPLQRFSEFVIRLGKQMPDPKAAGGGERP
jgi:hypothetical protein